ncbi:MAG: ribonuclease III [Verrucomicrobiales bacterium]|nr:ribonuclease III [Verrucomicrobiales bacterium]
MHLLQQKIAYQFNNAALLEQALTHPSLSYESQRPHADNQRLEFLGDAVLQLILTDELFRLFDNFPEGSLTKLRSRLVSRQALARYARRLGIGEFLRMGRGEELSGGRDRSSTLADALEALIAAVYLDSGFPEARRLVLTLLQEDLMLVSQEPVEINPKGHLQELLQSCSDSSPTYSIVSQEGPDHCKTFQAEVHWTGHHLGSGTGRSKKEAETAAAKAALENAQLSSLIGSLSHAACPTSE